MRQQSTTAPRWGNAPEAAFFELATAHGWTASKRGWPDFLCFGPDGQAIVVDVKPRLGWRLKLEQTRTMVWLESLGARCFVSDGRQLERFDVTRHAHRHYVPAVP